ncbi:MAG: extracellular solute-binding protein [Propionibacteriaceae bacterium]|nr:extracellular solute-binding protein [Propionibacteriaceae bacterium]
MRKQVIAILAALSLATVLAGCGGTPDSGSSSGGDQPAGEVSGKISFLHKWTDDQYAYIYADLVNEYLAAHPGVEIDMQAVGDQPIKDQLRVLTSADELPDIFFAWPGDFAKKFIRGGFAADLTEYLAGDWGDAFADSALGAYSYDGKNYGVPINQNAKVFAYSKSAFEKAGISVPTTYEELLATCEPLKAAGYNPIAFGNQYGWPAIHYITQLNAEYVPADVRNADYNPAGGAFTDPGYEQALTTFKDLIDKCSKTGSNGISHETAQAELTTGKAGMQYVEVLEFVSLDNTESVPAEFVDDWDFFAFPPIAGAAGTPGAITGAPDGFLVNAKSQNMALAIDFLKFLTSKSSEGAIAKAFQWPPAVDGAAEDAGLNEKTVRATDLMGSAVETAVWLDTETHAEVAQEYLAGVEKLLANEMTPAQVMESVRATAKRVAEENS